MEETSAPIRPDRGTTYGGTAIGAQLQQNIAQEKAAIDHEIGVLHRALEEAHTLVSQLESRISPVSTPLPPNDGSKAQHETVGSSRVYNAIHEASSGVHFLQDRLATVLSNLEV